MSDRVYLELVPVSPSWIRSSVFIRSAIVGLSGRQTVSGYSSSQWCRRGVWTIGYPANTKYIRVTIEVGRSGDSLLDPLEPSAPVYRVGPRCQNILPSLK